MADARQAHALQDIAGVSELRHHDQDGPIDVSLPTFVNLEVTVADPWARGDTSGSDTKPVTVQTGFQLQVPPFVEQGDKIQIDTRTGTYITRVKE